MKSSQLHGRLIPIMAALFACSSLTLAEEPQLNDVARTLTPQMDMVLSELLAGEPINATQGQHVVDEFGDLFEHRTRIPAKPGENEQDRRSRELAEIYLAAMKASLLYPGRNDGWPLGFGNLKEEGVPRRILDVLKKKALEPMTKVQRTMVNYAIIAPAAICGDKDALAAAEQQRAKDWPGNSVIAKKAAHITAWAESEAGDKSYGWGPACK